MASPDNNSSAAPSTIIPAPYATNDQHVCFICLQNDTDTPNATWVNPCPCSLEAHEECMLRWIAEMETASERPKGGLKCPACKAPITVDEPYDPIVALRDHLYRRYSRATPYILFALISGGGIAGAASYGWGAITLFSGSRAVEEWLGGCPRKLKMSVLLKMCGLAAIGPGLVITRWLSSLGIIVLVPLSVIWGGNLVAQDDLPTWPPSGKWAIALMPYVHLSYTYLYYDLFGGLERRLNRALRGRPPTDEGANQRDGEAGAGAAAEPGAAAVAPRDNEEANGVWGNVFNLGRAVLGLFLDWPAGAHLDVEVEIQENIEFRRGGEDNGEPEDGAVAADQARAEEDVMDGEDDEFQILVDVAAPPDQQQQIAQPPPPAEEQPAPQPPNQNNQNNQNPARNENNNNNNNNNNDGVPGEVSYFGAIVNSIVTSLLYPAISYGMGELIRVTAPKAWVTRGWRRPKGLLHERWGRSLVGGCLFVVLRDAIVLYTKYRRVQVKGNRKVRNVKRRGAGTAEIGQGRD